MLYDFSRSYKKRHGLGVICAAFISAASILPTAAAARAQITEYKTPGDQNQPWAKMPLQMSIDSKSNVWFGEFTAGKVTRFNSKDKTFLQHKIAPATGPMNIWVNPVDDSLWFSAIGDYVVKLTQSGQLTH